MCLSRVMFGSTKPFASAAVVAPAPVSLPFALMLLGSTSAPAMAACTGFTYGTQTRFVCTGDSVNNLPVALSDGGQPGNAVAIATPSTGITVLPDTGETEVSLENNANVSVTMSAAKIQAVRTATASPANSANLIGINLNLPDTEFTVLNHADVSVSHAGIGQAYGIAGNGDTEGVTIVNDGKISTTRGPITLTAVTATSLTARPNSATITPNLNAANLAVAAAIFTEEEVAELSVTNLQSGVIEASGQLSAGIYSRSVEFDLVNDGIIRHNSGAGNGIAIAAVSDSGEIRKMEFTNTETGVVNGDLVMANGQAIRWWALSNGLGTGGAGVDARLNINSQFGQLDSEIENAGTINGNFFYSNGTHVLENESTGAITGNIDVDHRDNVFSTTCTIGNEGCYTTAPAVGLTGLPGRSQDPTPFGIANITGVTATVATYTGYIWGTKDFTLENAGLLLGNVTVRTTDAHTVIGSYNAPASTITLLPHIFGSGAGSSLNSPSENSGFIDGTLKIWDGTNSTVAATTTLSPVIDATVRDGETYKVAEQLFGTQLPTVDGETALVSWDAFKNVGGSLVVTASVKDAQMIEGISQPGAQTINALIASAGADPDVDALGGSVQSLETDADVAKAGAQLAPETNFATQQAALTLSFLTGQSIDNRLAGVGATGPSQGFAAPSGLGMSEDRSEDLPGRMNMGASLKDDGLEPARREGGMWGQAFGSGLQQDERQSVDGYDAKIYGAIAGMDNTVSSGLRLGLAAGYANTQIDGDGATSANSTDINSYLGLLYASYKGTNWYASGRTGFTWHDYDTKRVLTVPFNDTASASHDGQQYTAALEVGAPLRMSGSTITPVASLTYNRLNQDGYTERSGAGMALAIGDQDTDSLQSGLGVKALLPIAADTFLEGRAIWLHEFEDTEQQVTASFAQGTPFSAAGPSVGRDTAAIGAGLMAYAAPGVTFQINYDALLREDFVAHAGSGKLRVEF